MGLLPELVYTLAPIRFMTATAKTANDVPRPKRVALWTKSFNDFSFAFRLSCQAQLTQTPLTRLQT